MSVFEKDTQTALTTVGVYVQVPFCQTKCTYCNFHTGVFSRRLYAPYVDAVCREIRSQNSLRTSRVNTVYIGGGTPSLLEPADLARILEAIGETAGDRWDEATLEADPETITCEKAKAWRNAGVTRMSMGVQSFEDKELRAAGRMHRSADVDRAMNILRDAGFDNVSMDLIAGLVYQTPQSWNSSLDRLLALGPEHVSVYLLEVDEGSRLGKEILQGGGKYGATEVPSDDAMAGFYERACELLARSGYEHYEISNWALPGRESRHNLKYWRREPYLGFGAGAHSFNEAKRWSNIHDPAAYTARIQQAAVPIEQEEAVTAAQALNEEFFLGLRQLAGVNLARIEREYGADMSWKVASLVNSGLLERDGDRIRLSAEKLTVSNEVFVELMD
ncbi:MAG TPA: radical SAM family heme chaperone HemW [Candidatus Acidoferrales bacterium]|nr:radical SAM family heme chaperone HemW [Candidatus Acidoferrales bacterium]